jgi:DNA-binding PadR family transcriptional regulator
MRHPHAHHRVHGIAHAGHWLDNSPRDGRGGRGGLGRLFAHGDLRLVILNLIAERPRHGYDLIRAIEDAVGGAYSPSPGTIYPTLTLLDELGHVAVAGTPDGARKLYEITAAGRAFLAANRTALDALLDRMAEAGRSQPGPPPQLVRALENLKLAVRLRLERAPLAAGEIDAIAAAIDAAAATVEKT